MNDSGEDTPSTDPRLAVIVLAAGMGTRMKSETAKVFHQVLGRSLIGWVLEAVAPLAPARVVAVVGPGMKGNPAIPARCAGVDVEQAVQQEPLGSGDALRAGLQPLQGFEGEVIVLNGDGALFTTSTVGALLAQHRDTGAAASALGIRGDLGLPYGRLITTTEGMLERIVEFADASEDERAVDLLNAGMYAFDAAAAREDVTRLSSDNAQGEYYITDLVEIARTAGRTVRAVAAGDADELLGVNTRLDLAEAELVLQRRISSALMLDGVTMHRPDTTIVEPTVRIAADATILPGCILRGNTSIAAGATVGPYSVLTDTSVASGAEISQSHAVDARIDEDVQVGPFAYLRPGTRLRTGSKIGTFVETKNTDLGPGSKANHLSYLGDATIGAGCNIGAGNITANYRPELGTGKQPTTIGDNVRTGSDNVLVAPLSLGSDSFTGAGSIITEDVPAGALAIARARQVNLPDYAGRLAKRADASRA